jgi:phosphopentomutase
VSTDHTREYVPLIVAGPRIKGAKPLGTRSTFADLGATICDYLALPTSGLAGLSVLGQAGVKP